MFVPVLDIALAETATSIIVEVVVVAADEFVFKKVGHFWKRAAEPSICIIFLPRFQAMRHQD
jgi:hypothetical protein